MPKSGGGPFFAGTINLDASTLIAMVRDVIRELVRHGVRKVCAIVGHYENQWIVTEGIDLAMRECGHTGLRVMRLEYWDFCTEDTLKKVFPDHFPGVALEHAAVMETSMMLHYYPEMVRLPLLPRHPPPASRGSMPPSWKPPLCCPTPRRWCGSISFPTIPPPTSRPMTCFRRIASG